LNIFKGFFSELRIKIYWGGGKYKGGGERIWGGEYLRIVECEVEETRKK